MQVVRHCAKTMAPRVLGIWGKCQEAFACFARIWIVCHTVNWMRKVISQAVLYIAHSMIERVSDTALETSERPEHSRSLRL